MINKTNIYIITLIILTGLLLGVFVFKSFYKQSKAKNYKTNNLFLKKLNTGNAIDNIKKIQLDFNGEKFTLIEIYDNNLNNQWVLVEKNNYPVSNQKIKELVFDLANLKIIEPKTTKSENFADLQLEDLTINKNTTSIVFLDVNNQEIDSVYIGKRDFVASANGEYKAHIFVRRPKESQAWLVSGKLLESFMLKDLVKQPIVTVDLANITQVELYKVKQSAKNSIKIARDPATKVLNLLDIPPRYKVKEQYAVDNIVQQFAYLSYDDVIVSAHDAVPVLTGKLILPQNTINFEIVYLNKNYYFKLNDSASNWLYKISDYACQSLLINKSDLLVEITKNNNSVENKKVK